MDLCQCLENVRKASKESAKVAFIQRHSRRSQGDLITRQEEKVQVLYAQVYEWHEAVQRAFEVDFPYPVDRLLVGINLVPFSIEETAMMIMVAEQRHWTYVPVDPQLSLSRQLAVLERIRVHRLVTTRANLLVNYLVEKEQRNIKCRLVELKQSPFASVQVLAFSSTFSSCRSRQAKKKVTLYQDLENNPLYVLFTSGTTGESKGVVGSRQGAWTRLDWMWQRYPFVSGETDDQGLKRERVIRSTKLAFVDSVWEILGAFVHFVPLVHFQSPRHHFDSTSHSNMTSVVLDDSLWFLHVIRTEQVTRFTAVPSVLEILLLQTTKTYRHSCLTGLRFVLSSGEALPLHVLQQLTATLPNLTILNLYGSTEVSGDVTCMELKPPFSSTQVAEWHENGVPIATLDRSGVIGGAQTSLLLLSEDFQTDSLDTSSIIIWPKSTTSKVLTSIEANSRETTGILYISGPLVAYGYVNDSPDARFVSLKKLPSENEQETTSQFSKKWFCTSDRCCLIQGRLYYRGRQDDAVKIHGQRVYMDAVEWAVAKALKNTTTTREGNFNDKMQILAFPIRKSVTKHGLLETYIVACIILDDVEDTKSARYAPSKAFKAWIAEHYGPSHIPYEVFIMSREAVPRGTNGKLDRQAVAEVYQQLGLKEINVSLPRSVESSTEGLITRLFYEILDRAPREESQRSLSFQELGGNSLLATLFVHELRQMFRSLSVSAEDVLGMKLEDIVAICSEEKQVEEGVNDTKKEIFFSSRESQSVRKRQKRTPFSHDIGNEQCRWTVVSRSNQSSTARNNAFLPTCCILPVPSTAATVPIVSSLSFSWELKREWAIDLGKCIDASPLVIQRRDVKGVVDLMWAIIGSHSAQVVCVNVLATGREMWRVTLDDRIEAGAAMSVTHQLVYIGTYAGSLYALNLESGSPRWTFHAKESIKSSALVVDEHHMVICGAYDNLLYGLDAKTGHKRWSVDLKGSLFSTPCYCSLSNQLCVATTKGSVFAFHSLSKWRSVETQWKLQLPAPVFAGLTVEHSSQMLLVGCADGQLYGMSLNTGEVQWQVATAKPIFSSPCVYEAAFTIVGSHDGKLRKVDCRTGDVVWKTDLESAIFASPTVVRCHFGDSKATTWNDGGENECRLCCVTTTAGWLVFCDETTGAIVYQTSKSSGIEKSTLLKSEKGKDDDFGPLFSSPVMIDNWCLLGTRTNYFNGFKIESRIVK